MLGNRSTYFSEVERGRPGTGRGSRRKRARERSGGKPRNRVPGHSACTSGNAADGCARVKERAAEPGAAGEGGARGGASTAARMHTVPGPSALSIENRLVQ